ncbi:TonB-dependent receptor plug domain-containing protein [Flavobacterium sp. RHBU_3]|uniref:TonB-dependent receptor plug domain-containing protein n=1 Tax=Flavobacterium sp. RHBU_3 TaxID=3391184 RepID=UPI003984C7C2
MALRNLFIALFILGFAIARAQQDTIALKEVVISDTQLHDFAKTQSVQQLSDSTIARSGASLTALLLNNSAIYFKENGPGMVSSPSFRGTSAQQTAVVWNGININSQLNGQTDFNTLNARDFTEVAVKAGGGSVVYGSSAIGGSVHLDNKLLFNKHFNNELRADGGSYDTYGLNYKLDAGTENFSAGLSLSRNGSDNRYKYPGYNTYNDNGQFYNTSLNSALGFKLNNKNILRLYNYVFDGERHFSRTLAAPSKSLYNDTNTRHLLEWTGLYGKFTSRVKAAYLYEYFKYHESYTSPTYSYGKVQTIVGRYDALYQFNPKMKLNGIADLTSNHGIGSSFGNNTRTTFSGALLWSHAVTDKFQYEGGLRQESGNVYSSPLLFSAGARYTVNPLYSIRINGSRNFRAPTFNDLYWESTGNKNLKPEHSYQAELGNMFEYKNVKLGITGYYIRLQDMLRWVPGTDGVWRPENLDKAKSYGAETTLSYQKAFGPHHINLDASYSYTVSKKDGSNAQLMYVPKHRAVATAAYAYNRFSVYYRQLFTGKVYYTTDNSAGIDHYNVSGIGAQYTFKVIKGLSVGAQANNLYNEHYMNVASRPMPGRNYTMYLIFKF